MAQQGGKDSDSGMMREKISHETERKVCFLIENGADHRSGEEITMWDDFERSHPIHPKESHPEQGKREMDSEISH